MSDHRPVYIPRRNRNTSTSNPPSSRRGDGGGGGDPLLSRQEDRRRAGRGRGGPRWHGAFTGGFSAGYFNTVGSKEGWQPQPGYTITKSTDNTTAPAAAPALSQLGSNMTAPPPSSSTQQRVEDFMDEQDHNEWGGPSSVTHQFLQKPQDDPLHSTQCGRRTAATAETTKSSKSTDTLLSSSWNLVVPQNVGTRLLRVLGWRESDSGPSASYVPVEDDPGSSVATNPDDTEATIMATNTAPLSKRRQVRKIQWQHQTHVNVPTPKVDLCGVGYEPYADAPEFRAHKEKRLQQQQRLQAQNRRNVYRVNQVLGVDDDLNEEDGDHYRNNTKSALRPDKDPSYESTYRDAPEELVGTRTVGGFAIRDDEDDAYDDNEDAPSRLLSQSRVLRVDRDEYDTELDVHPPSSDDDNDMSDQKPFNSTKNDTTVQAVGNIFSSWAQADINSTSGSSSKLAVAADGRPPLDGFVLGTASTGATTTNKRYRGPDLPLGYEIQRHVFGPNEHPLFFKALSHAVQLHANERQTKMAIEEALQLNANILRTTAATTNPVVAAVVPPRSTMKSAFAGVSSAMKSRFVSASDSATTDQKPTSDSQEDKDEAKDVKVTRTFAFFAPEPLLCKRFGVPVPTRNTADVPTSRRTKEEAFFHDEILSRLTAATGPESSGSDLAATTQQTNEFPEFEEGPTELPSSDRPPDETFKSIFDPPSDNDNRNDGDELEDASEKVRESLVETDERKHSTNLALGVSSQSEHPEDSVPETRMVLHDGLDHASTATALDASDNDTADSRRSSERRRHRRSSSERRKRRRKERKEKKRRKRSRSPSPTPPSRSDASSDDASRRHRKERKQKKSKKQRHRDRRDKEEKNSI